MIGRKRLLEFLPTAYVVRGKVMFWHVSVHPSVCPHLGGGYPVQVQPGGYPSQVQVGGYPTLGTPCQTWSGGYPTLGPPPSDLAGGSTPPQVPPPVRPWITPPHVRPGRGVPRQGDTPPSSTWYAAIGMPLAFTQEDFLVVCWFHYTELHGQNSKNCPSFQNATIYFKRRRG